MTKSPAPSRATLSRHRFVGAAAGVSAAALAAPLIAEAKDPPDHLAGLDPLWTARVRQYRCAGTDHGWGNDLLAIGGGVNGGRLYGAWPGLAEEALFQAADIWATTDYRSVFGECLLKRFYNNQLWQIFPGFTENEFQPLGVFSGSLEQPDFNDPEIIFRSGME